MSEPRYATAPTPGAPNDLHQIIVTAKALGTPLMPWQRQVARVASERLPEDETRFRYPLVVLTVPRQSGKTTLMRAVLTQRSLMNPNRRAFYTAQTGKDASARWNDLVKQIEQGPLARYVKKRMAAGSQSLTFPNGATISPFAPTAKSLHGYTPHDVMLDEIFAWDEAQGEDLMGAIKPAQITLKDRQLWLVSTMGTKESEFLHRWVDAGRQAVGDPEANVAYFEWSLDDGLDPYNPENWGFHPALGHTITMDSLVEASESHSRGEWMRAYMNRRSMTADSFIDPEKITAAFGEHEPPAWANVAVAYEADPQRRRAAIWASWIIDGVQHLHVVRSEEGVEWLAPEVARIYDEERPMSISADDAGTTRSVTEDLQLLTTRRRGSAGVAVDTLATRDFATACSELKAAIEENRVVIGESQALRDSLDAVVTRPLGESWAISRTKSTAPVCDAIAAAVALRAAKQTRSAPKPMIRVGS